MKKILVIIFILFSITANATTYYISTTGNDVTGNGSIGNPWKTLFKACQSVNTSGDIIHVNAGTYVETQQCLLAVGVSVEGEGITSVIKSTRTALFEPLLYLQSVQGTNGNQSVSFLKFDGTMTVQQGVQINGRSNVSVHDITMVDFFERGVVFTGALNLPLTNYATGNTCYNNTIVNCGQNNGTGYGCLNIGGQDGMLIYNNTITQNSRADGLNGWPIKYIDEGHLKNVKIYNNTFNKNMQTGLQNYIDWPFVMELFNIEGGVEIYNNICVGGGIDLVFMTKGASTYSVWVHDNDISCPTLPVATQMGVTGENMEPPNAVNIRDMIIERNTFTNLSLGVYFTARPGAFMDNIIIRNNLMKNHSGIGQGGAFINLGENGGATNYTNIDILNNTFIGNPSAPFYTGIILPSFCTAGATISNINIKNNIMSGTTAGSVFCQGNTVPISNLNISYNNFYNNNAVTDFRNGQVLTGYTNTNNTALTPTYASNYTLLSGSPMIDAGTNVGIAYSGAAPDKGYKEFIVGGNVAPSANAGVDRTITLPKDSVHLTGSGSDVAPGVITAYLWTKKSGPNNPTLSGSTTVNLTVTNMVAGTYVFTLQVTDDSTTNNTGTDDVVVIVNPVAGNSPPAANAGTDYSIELPINAVRITGTGSDPDGTVVGYAWHKISGPAYNTTDSVSPVLLAKNLLLGTYLFEFVVTDNNSATGKDTVQVTVTPHNGGVKTYAGPDETISTSTHTFYGAASGVVSSNTYNIFSTDISANINAVNGGLRLTCVAATDRSAARGTIGVSSGKWVWQVTCTTIGGSGIVGVAKSTTSLTTYTSSTGYWGYIPSAGYISHDGVLTGPVAGAIGEGNGAVITCYLDMTNGATNAGTFRVVVNGTDLGILYSNIGGTVYPIGGSYNDALPVYDFNFGQSGSFSYDAGYTPGPFTASGGGGTTISTYLWTKESGTGTITTSSAVSTGLTGLAGVSIYKLKATDNLGASDSDYVQITVVGGNIPPAANAGADQTITLPVSGVNLLGSGTDADGTISSYLWVKTQGTGGTITSPNSAVTNVTGLSQGTYTFSLTVTDNNGATNTDYITVTVLPVIVPNGTRRRFRIEGYHKIITEYY